MKDYHSEFLVKPNGKVKFKQLDSSAHDGFDSNKAAKAETQKYLEQLFKLQYLLYSEGKHSLLIVLQGLDTAGKDGVIRHVISALNPQGCNVTSFKAPTSEELAHDFLWRVHPHAPRKGSIAVFNRSHYEDVLVARVHNLAPEKVWSERYKQINDFERLLALENNTTILKFFLHISKDEQLARFKKRLDDPNKHWKISEADYSERQYWDSYMEAFDDLLEKTSTEHAPWFVIPSDHKWFRDLAIAQIIANSLASLKMAQPAPTVDIEQIRKKYHAAAKG
jgi:PPK2 family polyphosphate:nucleotide phosphotransferase